MYSKIKNPENSKMVSIHSKKGIKIIHNYLQELRFFHGGSKMELWQSSPEPQNPDEEEEYKKQWGFNWNKRFNYTSNRDSEKIFLDPKIIRVNESQLEASNKLHGLLEDKSMKRPVFDFKIGESFTTSWLEGYTFKITDIKYAKNQAGLDVPTFIYFRMWNGNKWGTTDFQENLLREISPGKNFLQTMKKTQTGGKKRHSRKKS